MNNIYVQRLNLKNYRNFEQFEINTTSAPIVLIGENGSGKTNILEALSHLFPGKGIRGARLDDTCKIGESSWRINSLLQSKIGIAEIQIQYYRETNKRSVEFNGSKIPNNELSKVSSIIWLIPQMDGLFLDGISNRRRFLDRIVYSFEPKHSSNVNKYEYLVQERSRFLAEDSSDSNWIKVIEQKIAEVSQEIAVTRIDALSKMQQVIDKFDNPFPKAILSIDSVIEEKLRESKNIQAYIEAQLLNDRLKDKISGRTNFGIHRSDFVVTHLEKNQLAKFCSTGEQKALLISIILAQANSMIRDQKISPIMLLDELFVHLDNRRKEYLTEYLLTSNIQAWITATDLNGIEKLASQSQVVNLI